MFHTIRAKLSLGFAITLILSLLVGSLGLINAKRIMDGSKANEHTHDVIKEVSLIRETLTQIETGQRGYLLNGQSSYLAPYSEGKKAITGHFDKAIKLTTGNEQPTQMQRLIALRNTYESWLSQSIEKTIEVRNALNRQEIDQEEFQTQFMRLTGKPLMDKMREQIAEIELQEEKYLEQRNQQADFAYTSALWSVGVALSLAMVIGLLTIFGLDRLLQTKLRKANQHIDALAKGQLNGHIEVHGRDEIDQLLKALASAQHNLRTLIQGIRVCADELSQNAVQVKDTSTSMSSAGAEQADATSTMAAAVEELTVSIAQISDNTEQATSTAYTAKQSAENGGETLNEVVRGIEAIASSVTQSAAAMQKLEQQSSDISEIISTITEIADRTNLLALNAAIEAARAGEQGRGFAVVADEVRKLAEQTKGSTDRISGMVYEIQRITQGAAQTMNTSVDLVQSGLSQADAVNQTIEQIKSNADRVSEAISAISVSMREQSHVSTEISRNVERVAQMTEENTAAAQQNTQVSGHLAQLSSKLMQSVHAFKTE